MDFEESLISELDGNDEKSKQRARSFLRERFLRAVTTLASKECSLHMHSNTNVRGIFRGSDIEFDNLLLEKLQTPFVEVPHAIIRSSDVHYLDFSLELH